MTRDKAFKVRVRARMAATGESYTQAQAALDSHGPLAPAVPHERPAVETNNAQRFGSQSPAYHQIYQHAQQLVASTGTGAIKALLDGIAQSPTCLAATVLESLGIPASRLRELIEPDDVDLSKLKTESFRLSFATAIERAEVRKELGQPEDTRTRVSSTHLLQAACSVPAFAAALERAGTSGQQVHSACTDAWIPNAREEIADIPEDEPRVLAHQQPLRHLSEVMKRLKATHGETSTEAEGLKEALVRELEQLAQSDLDAEAASHRLAGTLRGLIDEAQASPKPKDG